MADTATATLPAGTAVRTIYGEDAVLLADWNPWNCLVSVQTARGAVQHFHATKVFTTDGAALPYAG